MPDSSADVLAVRWDFSARSDGTGRLSFQGELNAASTPSSWTALQAELTGKMVINLEIDISQLVSDSAGLTLLYYLSTGRMTPGARVPWDEDLREIMNQINSDYAKTSSINR